LCMVRSFQLPVDMTDTESYARLPVFLGKGDASSMTFWDVVDTDAEGG
jgi:hypothetical protein